METNWIVTAGKAQITTNEIKYIPEIVQNQQGDDNNTPAFLRSNVVFDSGNITFLVKLPNPQALCQVILGTETGDINVGFNASGPLFGMTKLNPQTRQWTPLAGIGSHESFDITKEHSVKISVHGSLIQLYVDDVSLLTINHEVRPAPIQILFSSNEEILIKDFTIKPIKPKVFVIMQFSEEYNQLYDEVIKPVCDQYNLNCERADDYSTTSVIIQDIVNSIISASVVIADVTPDNPNVFYEVGYSHALNKPTILLCDKKRERLPFDISSFRTLFYENSIAGKTRVEKNLKKYLDAIFNTPNY